MSACSTLASSSTPAVSRTPSTKRKRTTKSPPDEVSPLLPSQPATFTFEARLFQLHGERSKDPAAASPALPPPSDPKQHMADVVDPAVLPPPPIAASPPPAAGQLEPSNWSFLAHPALRLLPKWPALYTNTTTVARINNSPATAPPPRSKPLNLLSLLDIPPIAASLAANLYGHDLLNLRRINTAFCSLLTAETSENSSRPYYHVLLRKTLLCPRTDIATEPVGTACRSAGGNVGPCVFCDVIICATCVSPEVWTTRRYRYICPPCAKTSTSCSATTTCGCQQNLWICRSCYKRKWLPDIAYETGAWISTFKGRNAAVCTLCQSTQTRETDKRIPQTWVGTDQSFKGWMKEVVRGKGKRVAAIEEGRRRPVACAWCVRRVDADVEEWGLRPEKIRRGEERGKMWMAELERRKAEKEGEGGVVADVVADVAEV